MSQDIVDKLKSGEITTIGNSKTKCSVCGLYGHMKTNKKKCPLSSLN
jgi:hypothetical protein